jgi:membrane associated rhomboid family serine protease
MFFPFHDDNPTTRIPLVTVALIVINLLAFLGVRRLPAVQQQVLTYRRGFMPARIAQLNNPRLVIQVPVQRLAVHPRFGWTKISHVLPLPANRREILLSLLTCMFLHGGWMHLIGNMWFLWLFGNNVEDRLGPVLFLVFYLLGGLMGSGCHWLRNPQSLTPVIGASGAVATVLGAYAITWPWARVHTVVLLIVFVTIVDLPALLVLGIWFVVQVLEGTRHGVAQGVAWWAHIGGFVAGLLLMPLLSPEVRAPRPKSGNRPEADMTDDW